MRSPNFPRNGRFALVALAICALPCAEPAFAASDEIQVYTDDINAPGERGLEVHTNYVTKGRKEADYPGERPPHGVLRMTPEFSWGLAEHWDMGLYLPLSYSDAGSFTLDGAKFRIKTLYNTGNVYYGANLEVGYSPRRVAENYWNSELRGIIGAKSGDWQVTVNPVLGWDMSGGGGNTTPDFDLAFKVAREVAQGWALGVEHYAELGKADHIHAWRESGQSTYAVVDYEGKGWEINFGVGHGWTDTADKTTIKAIFTIPFK